MKHPYRIPFLLLLALPMASSTLNAIKVITYLDSDFLNLDFEAVDESVRELDSLDFLELDIALPGWSASRSYLNYNQGHLGEKQQLILLDHQYWAWETPLEGEYSLLLSSGFSWIEGEDGYDIDVYDPAWISQTETVPTRARYIHLLADMTEDGSIGVSFAGHEIAMYADTETPNLWIGDISAFAGMEGELKIEDAKPGAEVYESGGSFITLDAIQFSTVPEPSAYALCSGLLALLVWIHRRPRKP